MATSDAIQFAHTPLVTIMVRELAMASIVSNQLACTQHAACMHRRREAPHSACCIFFLK
jgi:hypothetical protein